MATILGETAQGLEGAARIRCRPQELEALRAGATLDWLIIGNCSGGWRPAARRL